MSGGGGGMATLPKKNAGTEGRRSASRDDEVWSQRPLLEWHQAVAPNFICKSGGKGETLFLYIYSVLLFIQGAVRGNAHLQVL